MKRIHHAKSNNLNGQLSHISDEVEVDEAPKQPRRTPPKRRDRKERATFSEEESSSLLENGNKLLQMSPGKLNEYWEKNFDVSSSHLINWITSWLIYSNSRTGITPRVNGKSFGRKRSGQNI